MLPHTEPAARSRALLLLVLRNGGGHCAALLEAPSSLWPPSGPAVPALFAAALAGAVHPAPPPCLLTALLPAPLPPAPQHDIPALAAQAAATHPGVECVVADPIGIDSLMAQLIDNRVRAAAQHGAAVDPAAAAASGTAAMSSGSSGED